MSPSEVDADAEITILDKRPDQSVPAPIHVLLGEPVILAGMLPISPDALCELAEIFC
jgi:hypothetical protein